MKAMRLMLPALLLVVAGFALAGCPKDDGMMKSDSMGSVHQEQTHLPG